MTWSSNADWIRTYMHVEQIMAAAVKKSGRISILFAFNHRLSMLVFQLSIVWTVEGALLFRLVFTVLTHSTKSRLSLSDYGPRSKQLVNKRLWKCLRRHSDIGTRTSDMRRSIASLCRNSRDCAWYHSPVEVSNPVTMCGGGCRLAHVALGWSFSFPVYFRPSWWMQAPSFNPSLFLVLIFITHTQTVEKKGTEGWRMYGGSDDQERRLRNSTAVTYLPSFPLHFCTLNLGIWKTFPLSLV